MSTGDPVQQWCGAAARALADTADRAGRLSVALATDWLDDHGRAWAERVAVLRRELADTAEEADALTTSCRDPDDPGSGLAAVIAAALRASGVGTHDIGHGGGPRLGDTSGTRVDDERGVRIPELPDPPPY